jgi:hypothetical protein
MLKHRTFKLGPVILGLTFAIPVAFASALIVGGTQALAAMNQVQASPTTSAAGKTVAPSGTHQCTRGAHREKERDHTCSRTGGHRSHRRGSRSADRQADWIVGPALAATDLSHVTALSSFSA